MLEGDEPGRPVAVAVKRPRRQAVGMSYIELDALRASYAQLRCLAGELDAGDWEAPTRCPGLTVRQLVCHVVFGQERINKLFSEPVAGKVSFDRLSWWRYDFEKVGARHLADAAEQASSRSPARVLVWMDEVYGKSLDLFSSVDGRTLIGRKTLVIAASDMASARTLETGVHTMDVGQATLRGERLDPRALPVILEVLDGLLDAELPPALGWEARTYILTATGRRRLSGNERVTLGPLAGRFPLLR